MAGSGPSSRTRRNVGSQKRRSLRFELLDQRRVLASITGQVFHDLDLSLRKDETEVGLANRVVYLDLNDNQRVDRGEPLEFTDADGRFQFSDLAAGNYVVRLFNGTESQQQIVPFRPELVEDEFLVEDPFTSGEAALAGLAGDGLQRGYTASGRVLSELVLDANQVSSLELASDIHGFVSLGGGQVLAWTDQATLGEIIEPTPLAVVADFSAGEVTALDLTLPATTPRISDLAIAENQLGLFVPHFEGSSPVPLYSFALNTESQSWSTKPLELNVDSSAQLLASSNGPLVLVAQPYASGTQVALVSTVTEAVVSTASLEIEGGFEFLAFDDAASLAVAKSSDGTVFVFDTANEFATLKTIADWSGQLVLDGHRELLFGVDADGMLRIFDLVDGEDIATLALGEGFAASAALALTDGGNRLLIRRPSGVTQVRIDRIDAHRVTLTDLFETDPGESNDILFGMVVEGDNLVPSLSTTPTYEVLEDQTLFSPAPGLMLSLENPELDEHIAVQASEPASGVVILNPNGSLTYQPNADFFGTDTFNITISDGRDLIKDVPVHITIFPVDDGPRGLSVNIDPIPELTTGPAIIGTIKVDEVDGDHYIITINDPRFRIEDEEVILVGGSDLDFETEPTINIIITVTNPESPEDNGVYTAQLTIEDTDEPPTDILPESAEVEENVPGAVIATLVVVDEDTEQEYVLAVSDPRFIVVDRVLRLTDFVALDHEAEPTLTVTVTAATLEGEIQISRDIVITVTDAVDPITDITLAGQSLPELASGYRVGAVGVIQQGSNNQYSFGVDDSRFEIVDATLKLRDGVYVMRSEQAEIQLTISATPVGEGASFSKQFILVVTSNESPWHNYVEPTDVDNDGHTEPLDALIIINILNNQGPHQLNNVISYENGPPRYYDVNGDGVISPIDALIIINHLNRGGVGSAEPEDDEEDETSGESESPVQGLPQPIATSPGTFPYDDEDDED